MTLYFPSVALFTILEKTVVPTYTMFSFLDTYIPFVKEMIIPYMLWYFYIAIGAIYLGFVDVNVFKKMTLFLFIGMNFCHLIYALFPSGQALRPYVTQNDMFSQIIRGLYAIDTPTNCAPSIHVVNTFAITTAVFSTKATLKHKFIRPFCFVLTVMISMSTVMVKQHSILDVVWALILSLVLYFFIYKVEYKRADKYVTA